MVRSFVAGIALGLGVVGAQWIESASAETFKLEFRDGTIITANLLDSEIPWTSVSAQGEMSEGVMKLTEIESLTLTETPASRELVRVLQLVRLLESDDFWKREDAESELKKIGKRFLLVFKQEDSLRTDDGKYRLRRVLNFLESVTSTQNAATVELDRLQGVDGKTISGDAGEAPFRVEHLGKTRELSRDSLRRIFRGSDLIDATRPQASEVVQAQIFHDHDAFLKAGEVKLIDLEKDSQKQVLSIDRGILGVDRKWVRDGLILDNEYPNGEVRLSAYKFDRFKNLPVGGNSICNSASKTSSRGWKFRGVMTFEFCVPAAPASPAGVHQVGCFIGPVDHSRDILMEAYDVAGDLIAVCESSHESCSFCGVKSNVPIAKIRIFSNPWMLDIRRKVDPDYAIDNIYFSTPVSIDSTYSKPHLRQRNGDFARTLSIQANSAEEILVRHESMGRFQVGLSDVNCLTFGAPSGRPPTGKWMVRTVNGSHLIWDPKTGESKTLGRKISTEEIAAIWPATSKLHYPPQGDFEKGKTVIVFPGCRIATDTFFMDERSFGWKESKEKQIVLEEDLFVEFEGREKVLREKKDDVAPRSNKFTWDISRIKRYETPTIWIKPGSSLAADSGLLRLRNGERIAYGDNLKYRFKAINQRGISFEANEGPLTIAVKDMSALFPPQTNSGNDDNSNKGDNAE